MKWMHRDGSMPARHAAISSIASWGFYDEGFGQHVRFCGGTVYVGHAAQECAPVGQRRRRSRALRDSRIVQHDVRRQRSLDKVA